MKTKPKESKLLPRRHTESVFRGAPVKLMDGETAKREYVQKAHELISRNKPSLAGNETQRLANERSRPESFTTPNAMKAGLHKQSKDPREFRRDPLE